MARPAGSPSRPPSHRIHAMPTYTQIARSFDLWQEYVDTTGATSREEFDAMSHADRVALQVEAFGPEPPPVPTVNDVLGSTHLGGHFHEWSIDGGVIRVTRDELRPALEAAYDATDANWPALVELADA